MLRLPFLLEHEHVGAQHVLVVAPVGDRGRGRHHEGVCRARGAVAASALPMRIPEGFAHGFVVVSEAAEFLYKTTDYWAPEHERCIAWNDPTLALPWPVEGEPSLSAKDKLGARLEEAEVFG